jgi:hypothetical protein
MHPGGLIAVLRSALVLVVAGIGSQAARPRLFAAGAIVGGLLLVKVNVGLLALSGFALTAAYFVQPFCRYASVRVIVSACFVGMSFVLTEKLLGQPTVQIYASHVALASLGCVVVMARNRGLNVRSLTSSVSIPVFRKSQTSTRATSSTSGLNDRRRVRRAPRIGSCCD